MDDITNDLNFLTGEEIKDIVKSHLKPEAFIRQIESIFDSLRMKNQIKYDPYYQRNYCWDRDKATNYIESILLGTETPPLIFFKDDEYIEVIDGATNKLHLGYFSSCRDAIKKAKEFFDKVDGCYYCSSLCHTR